ncbi:MAG TPA: cytochrome c oxidase subunit II [Steroidobacteraceae bacterium]|jgi:cytochrome c oxidase subunit 2|nr:cytochrome c oxidase subunit II [Steroidobacteraceae bacterium]
MKNRHARRGLQAAAVPLFALLASVAHADWGGLNMTEGVTILSKKIYGLHMLILWVCVVIAVVVFAVMIYSIIKFRKSQGAQADTTLVHSTKVEIVWTVIPIAILVFMAVPIARTLIEIEDMGNVNLNIKVTGYQWKWEYEYLGQNVSFFSTLKRDSDAARQLDSGIDPKTIPNYLLDVDNHLVIPAGQKVRFLLTAQDVIHAWWVPAFGMKKDAIPGYVNEIWVQVDADKVGTYRGQCAELCGRDHGFMPIVVDVKSPAEFDAWLRAKQAEQKLAAVAPDAPAVTASAAPAAVAQ